MSSAQNEQKASERPFVQPADDSADIAQTEKPAPPQPRASENEERRLALVRGQERRLADSYGTEPVPGDAPIVAWGPFAALAENVREYAIFLLDPNGVITYWGEGARLMKWWLREEAEGAHLRLLYKEEGSEDGTAEAHLEEAAEKGEYVGEGQRVRRDGSKFWAGVTLTALRHQDGTLVGFAKVTRDLTARLAMETALAEAGAARADRTAALEQVRMLVEKLDMARESHEFMSEQVRSAREFAINVLEPEITQLRTDRANLLRDLSRAERRPIA